jgi:hypothetical protein
VSRISSTSDWLARIHKLLPPNLTFHDTGAPRGERNFYSIRDDWQRELYGSFSLEDIFGFLEKIQPSTDKNLKVWGWQGYRSECLSSPNGARQTREICCAPTKAAVARIAGVKRPALLWNLGETVNAMELFRARSSPGKVLWRPLDGRRTEFREAQPK